MLVYNFYTDGRPLSRYARSLIEFAPPGVIVQVTKLPGPTPSGEFFEVWFDELESWPDEKA